jgi:hypothetical protein
MRSRPYIPYLSMRRLETAGFTPQQVEAVAEAITEASRHAVKRAVLIAFAMWIAFYVILVTVVYKLQ